jgi:hypothetical protein
MRKLDSDYFRSSVEELDRVSLFYGSVKLLFVEPLPVLHVIVWVVTCEWIRYNLLISVTEVDVPHVLFIEEHIRVQVVVVPEVMEVVATSVMSYYHCTQELGHTIENVCVEYRSSKVEP